MLLLMLLSEIPMLMLAPLMLLSEILMLMLVPLMLLLELLMLIIGANSSKNGAATSATHAIVSTS